MDRMAGASKLKLRSRQPTAASIVRATRCRRPEPSFMTHVTLVCETQLLVPHALSPTCTITLVAVVRKLVPLIESVVDELRAPLNGEL